METHLKGAMVRSAGARQIAAIYSNALRRRLEYDYYGRLDKHHKYLRGDVYLLSSTAILNQRSGKGGFRREDYDR